MGIYYDPDSPAMVPDGFLSIGVPRIIDSDLRLSYVLWEEQKVPMFRIRSGLPKETRRIYGQEKRLRRTGNKILCNL